MARDRYTAPPVLSQNVATRGCGGKRCYDSHHVAERMARNTRRQKECRVSAYKCRHCHHWHVGDSST